MRLNLRLTPNIEPVPYAHLHLLTGAYEKVRSILPTGGLRPVDLSLHDDAVSSNPASA